MEIDRALTVVLCPFDRISEMLFAIDGFSATHKTLMVRMPPRPLPPPMPLTTVKRSTSKGRREVIEPDCQAELLREISLTDMRRT